MKVFEQFRGKGEMLNYENKDEKENRLAARPREREKRSTGTKLCVLKGFRLYI